MSPQPAQINAAQLEKLCQNLERRIDAKRTECDSLRKLGLHAGHWLALLVASINADFEPGNLDFLSDTVDGYINAVRDQELVTLEEWEIQLRGYQSVLRQMQSGIVTPTGMKVGRG